MNSVNDTQAVNTVNGMSLDEQTSRLQSWRAARRELVALLAGMDHKYLLSLELWPLDNSVADGLCDMAQRGDGQGFAWALDEAMQANELALRDMFAATSFVESPASAGAGTTSSGAGGEAAPRGVGAASQNTEEHAHSEYRGLYWRTS